MQSRNALMTGVLLLAALPLWAGEPAGAGWPQFRGPAGAGVSEGRNLPARWSADENVAWSVEVPGRGWSSPIVWGHRVMVTSAVSAGAYKEPSTGIYGNDYVAELQAQGLSMDEIMKRVRARDIEATDEVEDVRWMVYCLDAATGKILWEKEAHRGKPVGGRHRKNTFASETPVTDGERIYAYFGNIGVYSYSLDGELLWSHKFSPHAIYLDFGTAASPVLDDERVYILNDNEENPFLTALDKKTGAVQWTIQRDLGAQRKSGWATPFVWRNELRTEIVTIGQGYAVSYDPQGKELWRLRGLRGQATPTPLAVSGLLYVGTGAQTGNNRPLFAVRPGASGDISLKENETANQYVAWHQKSATPYVPSPLIYRGRLYSLFDNGIFTAYDARTGEQIYRARVGEGSHHFSSSPWAYDGKVFCLSEDGATFVVEAGGEFRQLAQNTLGEMSLASPAIAGGSLFIRTLTRLYCIRAAAQ